MVLLAIGLKYILNLILNVISKQTFKFWGLVVNVRFLISCKTFLIENTSISEER